MAALVPTPRNTGPMKPGQRRRQPQPRPRPDNSRVVPQARRAARVAHNRVPEARMPRRRFNDVPRARPGAARPLPRQPRAPRPRFSEIGGPGDLRRGPIFRIPEYPGRIRGTKPGEPRDGDMREATRDLAAQVARRRAAMVRPAALPNRGLVRLSQRRMM